MPKSAPERGKISKSAPKSRKKAPGGDKKEAAGGTRGFVKYLPKSAF